jgi:hypothetical protein
VKSSRGQRYSYGTAVVALALVFSQAAELAHLAGRTHVACLEHGELAEASDAAANVAATETAAPLAQAGDAFVLDRLAVTQEAAHDHCVVAASLHRQATTPRPAAVVPPPEAPIALAPAVTELSLVSIEQLRLAPKQSPPRGA